MLDRFSAGSRKIVDFNARLADGVALIRDRKCTRSTNAQMAGFVRYVATRNCRDHPSSNRGNHGPIIGAPAAPHIATALPAKSATQTAGGVTVTAIAVTGSTTEVVAKVIAAKNITFATAAARECVGGKPGTSENKDNCKDDYGVAQH
jgi:hypothetical protein